MPSFDVVSEVNTHEVVNAVDQANREVANRFDFKGANAKYEYKDNIVTIYAEVDFQLKQMMDILQTKLIRRGIDITCLEIGKLEISLKVARQTVTLRQGIDMSLAKQINKLIKDSKLKVQSTIQGDKIRVNGKKKDELQQVIAFLKGTKFDMPLQFNNFRD